MTLKWHYLNMFDKINNVLVLQHGFDSFDYDHTQICFVVKCLIEHYFSKFHFF
jgi:hypothetical protein